MKRSLLLVSLLLSTVSNNADNQGKVLDTGLLWEVSGNGLKKPSYLLGTFHLANINFLDSIPGAMEKFMASEILVTEIKADSNGSIMPDMRSLYMQDTSLKDLLSPVQYSQFSALVRNWLNMDPVVLNNIRPGFVMAYLIEAMMTKINGEEAFVEKMDMGLMKSARKMGKMTGGLETMKFQMEVLRNLGSLQRQADQLAELVTDTSKAKKDLLELYEQYKKGNLNSLYSMSRDSGMGMNEAETKQLLTERNEAWLQLLPGYFNNGSCYVAVGALHLAGPEGLIVKLRKMGYKVKPVTGSR